MPKQEFSAHDNPIPANVKTWVNKAKSAVNRTLTTNQVAKVQANAISAMDPESIWIYIGVIVKL